MGKYGSNQSNTLQSNLHLDHPDTEMWRYFFKVTFKCLNNQLEALIVFKKGIDQ